MPQELDDEIKKYHADFYMAATFLHPEEVQDVLPVTLPMTNILNDELIGIAKYPIDVWRDAGEPRITTKGWIKLCMMIARKDLEKLNSILKWAQSCCPDCELAKDELIFWGTLSVQVNAGSGFCTQWWQSGKDCYPMDSTDTMTWC